MSQWLTNMGSALGEELGDLIDLDAVVRLTVRLVLAAILAGVIGYERGRRGKAAGIRTHMLVALGSALFLAVPQQMGMDSAGLTRVLQGLIAGIGFLGAGAILKGKEQQQIVGLTTAASLWMTAAIGCTCGLGRGGSAIVAAGLAWIVLEVVPRVFERDRIEDRRGCTDDSTSQDGDCQSESTK